jgi:hypothetical protein
MAVWISLGIDRVAIDERSVYKSTKTLFYVNLTIVCNARTIYLLKS